MITSKQLNNLLEKYSTSRRTSNGYMEVIENPSSSELINIVKASKKADGEIRFLADAKTRIVYVFNADLGLHFEARNLLNMGRSEDTPNILDGVGEVSGGRAKVLDVIYLEKFIEYGKESQLPLNSGLNREVQRKS